MRKRLKGLMVGLLVLHLQGCATTIYNWTEVPDKDALENYTQSEKQKHYQHFAIDKFVYYPFGGHHIGFTTQAEPETVYDLYSYAPILAQTAPKTNAYFNEALNWEKGAYLTYLLTPIVLLAVLVGVSVPYTAEREALEKNFTESGLIQLEQNVNTYRLILLSGLIIGVGLATYFSWKETEQYDKIKEEYNAALKKHLQLQGELSWQLPEPAFVLTETAPETGGSTGQVPGH